MFVHGCNMALNREGAHYCLVSNLHACKIKIANRSENSIKAEIGLDTCSQFIKRPPLCRQEHTLGAADGGPGECHRPGPYTCQDPANQVAAHSHPGSCIIPDVAAAVLTS